MTVNQLERASRLWKLLVQNALSKKKITYKEVSENLNIHWRALRFPLGLIQEHCMIEQIPPLTILVVNSHSGLPGEGFIASEKDELAVNEIKVFEFQWGNILNPFEFAEDVTNIEEIINKILIGELSNETIKKIKDRGVIQNLLKIAALKIYKKRCAFCGVSIEELLEACHIKPWNECDDTERKDIKNIILLCRNHHKLFDSGIIQLAAGNS